MTRNASRDTAASMASNRRMSFLAMSRKRCFSSLRAMWNAEIATIMDEIMTIVRPTRNPKRWPARREIGVEGMISSSKATKREPYRIGASGFASGEKNEVRVERAKVDDKTGKLCRTANARETRSREKERMKSAERIRLFVRGTNTELFGVDLIMALQRVDGRECCGGQRALRVGVLCS